MARFCQFALFVVTLLFSCSSFATTYYIAASGSDSNNGTSKTTPWQHAPGMNGCSANCASKTPAAGDQFILKGGDVWHWGTGSPTGIPWSWNWSGTSGSRIYIGVDKTWFSGASWTRPTMNGDNPLSTSAVGSCSFFSGGQFTQNANFVDFDNVEFKGMCWSGADGRGASSCGSGCDYSQLTMNAGTHDSTFQNLYIHGWTHTPFSCSYTTQLNGTCDVGMSIINDSHSTGDVNNQYIGIVVDGSDSDRRSGGCIAYGGYDIHNSVCRYNAQAFVTNNTRFFHDNLIEFIDESSDGVKHSNGWELNGSNTDLDWYNNVVRHIGTLTTIGVNLWFNPGGTLRAYNNVVYDIHAGANYWDVAGNGPEILYNNTLEGVDIANNTFQPPITSRNNHFIGCTSVAGCFLSTSNVNDANSVMQTDAVANGQGYVASNNYAPTSSGNATVGKGTNLTSVGCSTFTGLCQDTTLGVAYDSVNHVVIVPGRSQQARPSTGTWDVGAYYFGGGQGAVPPSPPTGLTAIVH